MSAIQSVDHLLPSLHSHGHSVQFYGEDDSLVNDLSLYFARTLNTGDVGVIIATKAHRDRVARRLIELDVDVARARARDKYIEFDADETLATISRDGWPDAERFSASIGGILGRAAEVGRGERSHIAVFGEMVALLFADGKTDAAIRLEQFWNELARTRTFSLRCAYPLGIFERAEDADSLALICAEHAHVFPTESYTRLHTDDDRSRAVLAWQQKAQALAAEIVERHSAQDALRQRESELADFLENAIEGIQQVGADQRILWANRAMLRLLGYPTDAYVGHSFRDFHVDSEDFDRFWQKLKSREDIYDFPVELRCRDGSTKHVLINSNGLWENGQFVRTGCFIRDITEQKQLERDLRASVERAEAAVRVREDFLAIAAHELKTPVTAIKGSTQLLLRRQARGDLNEERLKGTLAILSERATHLAQLTSDLLDVSRLQAGGLPLSCDAVDLNAIAERAVKRAHDQADGAITIELCVMSSSALVWGDSNRLEQVLNNVLDNSIKYSLADGVVTIQVEPGSDRGYQLSIRDRGIGLPDGVGESIFEPFGRGPNVLDTHLPGMGLGLFICRQIVEQHGGRIWAESPGEGQGATFYVWLPGYQPQPDNVAFA